ATRQIGGVETTALQLQGVALPAEEANQGGALVSLGRRVGARVLVGVEEHVGGPFHGVGTLRRTPWCRRRGRSAGFTLSSSRHESRRRLSFRMSASAGGGSRATR